MRWASYGLHLHKEMIKDFDYLCRSNKISFVNFVFVKCRLARGVWTGGDSSRVRLQRGGLRLQQRLLVTWCCCCDAMH